ncbi:granulocyte colony-stimulating factor receptor [Notolabrus celidotus]|uniref:granulocyte colony-stimulating factor receptor n=1 Tax=Notolabrus celidotus TaxID=1203425 RepID=UPI00149031A5|nr:granulocyte colony-stimulating factor receptor [Notolabrus celidotus]XP_034554641.1 granulocyte colony-stimulating factor receptor [Notolabrus celidotus]XP_034554642.1 granulocyte colony-stimulating factor receptor [Notolabrus celidotus]
MISTWVSVIVMLVAFVDGVRNEDGIQPCAQIQTSSSLVPMGSPVSATCIIRKDCPLVIGRAVQIEWRLGDRILPSSPGANESSRVSQVVIPSFSHTRAFLTCCVQASTVQVVAGVEIRAGYPPAAPQNVSCQTNLTTPITLTCRWDPGEQETHLLTKYTLHTEIWDTNENHSYDLLPGVHDFIIPRSGFVLYSDMEVYVKAVNELGEATSVPIILEPVSEAKFDPPNILNIEVPPKKLGCLKLRWSLSKNEAWIMDCCLNLEVRLRTADSIQWSQRPIPMNKVRTTRPSDLCRLLHGTWYVAQIRVRYKQSPWSEWSSSQSGVTLESAPTGRLDSWMKVSRDEMNDKLSIQLFWKPSKQFRANSQNVSYTVIAQKLQSERVKLCSTTGNYCTFHISSRAKKVYLSAVNRAGKSPPTEVRIYPPKAVTGISDVSVVPQDDTSLLVKWSSQVSSSRTGFVVEWKPLLNPDLSLTQFEKADKNQTSLVITGSFEPYKPYGISVYPRFKDGIGLPQTVNAYSRQKAPSMVPKITIKKTWQSNIELIWDEIPLDQMNGIIKNYKVFYWNEKGVINVADANPKERKVVLTNLDDVTLYDAFMMVSTFGGSRNGSTINFETEPFDVVSVLVIAIASLVGLCFFIIFIVMGCSSKHKRLKGHFWPVVPDPANSSIKRWTSESTQDSFLASDNEEPTPVYLSHLSFLDIPAKLRKENHDDVWLNSPEDTSDLGESICGSPLIPGYSGSNSDSVPYATVIFSDPCSSPTPSGPPVYLRSESTQPLLETEESFSPKCYQNMATDERPTEQCFFGPSHDCVATEGKDLHLLWDDFPFLRALAINDSEND